jgi:hypothetical protein
MEATTSKARVESSAIPVAITIFKVILLLSLHIGAFWVCGSLINITTGMNAEFPLVTRLSLAMVQSKLLLAILIIGSGIIVLNEKKTKDPRTKKHVTQIIYIGLVILHVITIFSLLLVLQKLLTAT